MSSGQARENPPAERSDGEEAGAVVLREAERAGSAEPDIAALVQADATPEQIASVVETLPPADAADTLEAIESDASLRVLDAMEDEQAAHALAEMERPLAAEILQHDLEVAEAARYLLLMDSDDAADLVQALPKDRASALLRAMPRGEAAELGRLCLYDPESAGGIMTTDFLRLRAGGSVGDAREQIRRNPEDLEYLHLYCVSDEGALLGAVTIKSLLLAKSGQALDDIMEREVVVLRPDQDREEVARIFDRYDYLALPVVDDDRRLLGLVTIDDVLDIIRAENTEDAYKQVGAGPREAVYSPLREKIRSRMPWLTLNLLTGSLGAMVISRFEPLIAQVAFLAVLMPMIANQAGNAGQQSLAVTLRGLVLGEVRRERVSPLLIREVTLGIVSGAIAGATLGVIVALLALAGLISAPWEIGLLVAIAMIGALGVGCFVGAGIPLLMQRLGFDPATASTIFLTMLTDAGSFLAFLGLASLGQHWLQIPMGG